MRDLILVATGFAVACPWIWAAWRYRYAYGKHEGTMTERERWIERGRRERERKLGPPPRVGPRPAAVQDSAPRMREDSRTLGPLDAAVDRHPSNRRRRVATTVADLAPVVVPEPGTVIPFRPQAARTSGAGTQTMPRLTDTGELRELRKLTEAWEERTRREAAVWSHEYHERCENDRKELLP